MGTLYDLLGALPDDDAEGLRTAFRKAAKATHPDLNPDNPEAALRFRQLVRAHDILSDEQQRAAYDQLLAIATRPLPSKSKRVYEKLRTFASSTIAATIITGVLVASYALLSLVSRAPVAAEMAALAPADIAAAADLTGRSDTRESMAIADEVFATGAIAPAINARGPWMAGAVPVSQRREDVHTGISERQYTVLFAAVCTRQPSKTKIVVAAIAVSCFPFCTWRALPSEAAREPPDDRATIIARSSDAGGNCVNNAF